MGGAELDAIYEIEMDLPGETLIYREPTRGRHSSVICTFGGRPILSPRTLGDWWYPAERRREAMDDGTRAALIARIAAHARGRLGLSGLEIEE